MCSEEELASSCPLPAAGGMGQGRENPHLRTMARASSRASPSRPCARRAQRYRDEILGSRRCVVGMTGLGPELDAARARVVERGLTQEAVAELTPVVSA